MCVYLPLKGFEPSSSNLVWGEVKHNLVAGPAPRETASRKLKVSPLRCCLSPAGNSTETLRDFWCVGGLLRGSSSVTEENAQLPFCSWLVRGCSLAAQRCPLCHLSSLQTALTPYTVHATGRLLLSDTEGGHAAGSASQDSVRAGHAALCASRGGLFLVTSLHCQTKTL